MKWRRIYMTNDEIDKYNQELSKHKYTRKNCGRKIYIHKDKEKAVCSWCGKYVFKNKENEFRYRMKEVLK